MSSVAPLLRPRWVPSGTTDTPPADASAAQCYSWIAALDGWTTRAATRSDDDGSNTQQRIIDRSLFDSRAWPALEPQPVHPPIRVPFHAAPPRSMLAASCCLMTRRLSITLGGTLRVSFAASG